jgi:coproporphyrinogen III oxidase
MRARAHGFVAGLQDAICSALEALDGGERFREDTWERPGGGGGRTRVLEGGRVFEKAGVNTSEVYGTIPARLSGMPGDGDQFCATGISLVLHPGNPHVPTTHANFRYIERGSGHWFGGGADLTPYVLYEEDAVHFHRVLRAACDAHDPAFYPRFKEWCDAYFFLPHRGEARGVGGLFFDTIQPDATHDAEALFAWWRDLGEAFLGAYTPIVERRRELPFDEALRHWQLLRRGRYVEFNLLYDRGTKFGLETDGRAESILMSLPPLVRWDYAVEPPVGSPELRLLDSLRTPRAWLAGS